MNTQQPHLQAVVERPECRLPGTLRCVTNLKR